MGGKLWLWLGACALGAMTAASIAGAGALPGSAASGTSRRALLPGCPAQTYVQPFRPWLDIANYVLMPNGALESSTGWKLSGGAKLVSGNEPWHVNKAADSRSLSLPSGSSATSPSLCITLLHPDLRLFAVNKGSLLATLKVEAITQVLGITVATPIGVLLAGGSWQPTLPLPFLYNLTAPTGGTIAFRFTPIGANSGWRIDDVYVDPFKES